MNTRSLAALLLAASIHAQPSIPIFIGPVINFLPPALDSSGRTVAFGASVGPQGQVQNTLDLYTISGTNPTKLVSNITSVALTPDASRAIFVNTFENGGEAIGIVDAIGGSARNLAVDTRGCIRPLALCLGCFFACVTSPHVTPDGKRVLYAVRRNQPFFLVGIDGSSLTQLPVYTGSLAPSPQRVISDNGLIVFTSSAPFGPTFAASATDVYVMNMDGTNIRKVTDFGNNSSIFASNATISADGSTVVFETNYTTAGPGQCKPDLGGAVRRQPIAPDHVRP